MCTDLENQNVYVECWITIWCDLQLKLDTMLGVMSQN